MGSRGQSVRATGVLGPAASKRVLPRCAAPRKKPRAEVRGLVGGRPLCAPRGAPMRQSAPSLAQVRAPGRAVPARRNLSSPDTAPRAGAEPPDRRWCRGLRSGAFLSHPPGAVDANISLLACEVAQLRGHIFQCRGPMPTRISRSIKSLRISRKRRVKPPSEVQILLALF
jgi:hypothetical protein